ncbi:MAG: carboxypeptidase regulatory-like domain-containing protein [Planctomycetales bacterium]|nr:carboxypeptidase regulatory-like domain-containing protein [Planctomycetales bacterium]MCA9195752.1 carboxypeptidase regulatory-like domain-containing protein [Planctomycetales bacterium]
MKIRVCALWFGCLVSLCGCGETDNLPRTVKAEGIVLLDGSPIDGASIVFAETAGEYYARGFSDDSGRFSLDAFESKRGAVPGSYKVTVSKTVTVENSVNQKQLKSMAEDAEHAATGGEDANVSWVNDLPPKYANFTTSGIEVTIPEDGTEQIKIELTLKK